MERKNSDIESNLERIESCEDAPKLWKSVKEAYDQVETEERNAQQLLGENWRKNPGVDFKAAQQLHIERLKNGKNILIIARVA